MNVQNMQRVFQNLREWAGKELKGPKRTALIEKLNGLEEGLLHDEGRHAESLLHHVKQEEQYLVRKRTKRS